MGNKIGSQGMKHLANALEKNEVTHIFTYTSFNSIIYLIFSTDTVYT